MPDGLYDRDALLWAEQQADLLRRLASGERVNDAVDWPSVIEEVHDVGLSMLRSCESLLMQALLHMLKMHQWPDSMSVRAWRGEAATFLVSAGISFSPSMRQRIDVKSLYGKARRILEDTEDASGEPRSAPPTCPFALDELLHGRISQLVAKLEA